MLKSKQNPFRHECVQLYLLRKQMNINTSFLQWCWRPLASSSILHREDRSIYRRFGDEKCPKIQGQAVPPYLRTKSRGGYLDGREQGTEGWRKKRDKKWHSFHSLPQIMSSHTDICDMCVKYHAWVRKDVH